MSELGLGGIKLKNTTKKVSYSLDIKVVEDFDKLAKARGYNKSRTINNLIKSFLKSENSLV